MDILIICPFCNRVLVRSLRDVLTVDSFSCDCSDKSFKFKLKAEIIEEEPVKWETIKEEDEL